MIMNNAKILWTASDAIRATGGHTKDEWMATGVSINTRSLNPGDLFVALNGPNLDGHNYVADAFKKGAAAAVVQTPSAAGPELVTADSTKALRDLATQARARTDAKVIAVTGSVGKTGTKEALKLVLGRQGRTHASEGNLNNEFGVPLTLTRMPADTQYGVIEMGMNHPGELTPLSHMVRPNVCVVTTIESAHAEHFSSMEEIADAKAEIFAGAEPGACAVLNRDNPYFDRLEAAARAQGIKCIVGFGQHEDSTVRLIEYFMTAGGAEVSACIKGERVNYTLGVPGRHWVMNSLAVLGAVLASGADVAEAALALKDMRAPEGRGETHTIAINGGTITLIDDSYNANPASVRAALSVLANSQPGTNGRRIAVLGDMLELGQNSVIEHAALSEDIMGEGIDLTFTAGVDMNSLWSALPRTARGGHTATAEMLSPLLINALVPGDVVLVKGSSGSRMNTIVSAIKALNSPAGQGGGSTARLARRMA